MSEELKELLGELKDSIDYPRIIVPSYDGSDDEEMRNDKCFTPKDCKVLLDYIEQLKNNWNKLKNWLEEEIDYCSGTDDTDFISMKNAYESAMLEMQELEGSND